MRRVALFAIAIGLAVAPAVPTEAGGPSRRDPLERYAADTWHSFERMVDPQTGLPADNIDGRLRPRSRSAFTSPTNIGMYLWATIAARDLGLVSEQRAVRRVDQTLDSVERLERHEPSGQFYNWYDPATLAKLTVWPEGDHDPVYPFLSSVDNGWLAAALLMVAEAVPEHHHRARTLAESMHFDCYYDPAAKPPGPGLIRGGFWLVGDAPGGGVVDDYCKTGGEDVLYTGHHYGSFNTEPRIASYVGIAMGQIPAVHYFGPWRTFPNTCNWSWPEQRPVGEWRNYAGVDVFEGAYRFDDQLVVPTWGGSMFEALMTTLVVPEAEWGITSWAVTHPLYVEAQIEFGMAGYGYWGFSPASNPAGGYREYGVDAIGMEPNGYAADVNRLTFSDPGWPDPACPRDPKAQAGYGEGVVTPHAAFLALPFAREAALDNLAALAADFPGLYGRGGFKDSVNVTTGQVADRYLSLDQGMVMAALANELTGGAFRDHLAGVLRPTLQPMMAVEEFGAGRVD